MYMVVFYQYIFIYMSLFDMFVNGLLLLAHILTAVAKNKLYDIQMYENECQFIFWEKGKEQRKGRNGNNNKWI